jgi:hypothetical protein
MSESAVPPTRRRWFRWLLSLLFVVLTIAAACLGWMMHWTQQRHDIANHLREELRIHAYRSHSEADSKPPWPLSQLGDPGYSLVTVLVEDWKHPNEDDEQRAQLARSLFPEARLEFAVECQGGRTITVDVPASTRDSETAH